MNKRKKSNQRKMLLQRRRNDQSIQVVILMVVISLKSQVLLVLRLLVWFSSFSIHLLEEADFFRALSGSASKKIPTETLRQLGWSEARIKAFRNREKNPNQYYYRFNDPGEPQQTGKWSPKDKALFLKLIREKGVDYQVFSIHYSIHYSGVFSLNRYQVG